MKALEKAKAEAAPILQDKSLSKFDEFFGGLSVGVSLPFLSIRGKEFRLRKDGMEINLNCKELEVIFVGAVPHISKRYYPSAYSGEDTTSPACYSIDGVRPDENVLEPISETCAQCPMNVFGSATSGKGKACSDYKRVIVWPFQVINEPVILDIPATSLKAPRGQKIEDLLFFSYMTALKKNDISPLQVVTKIKFTGAEYSQLCFQYVRFITPVEAEKIKQFRALDDVKYLLGIEETEQVENKKEEKEIEEEKTEEVPSLKNTSKNDKKFDDVLKEVEEILSK